MPSDFIPYSRQHINENDIDAVVNVLKSDFLTQGPTAPAFERSLEKYCGAKNAISVNSATAALHISLLSLGVGPGDYVWTSPISFVASANSALYCGANVDFVDIDSTSYNMCPVALEKKLEEASVLGVLPKVVIPVHLSGLPCDMKAIHTLSVKYGFGIVEDASHAIGSSYFNSKIGSCKYSDVTVFSFHPVKIMTTAEGGVAITNDDRIAQKLNLLRSHGITRDPAHMTNPPHGLWYYQQIELGFNYRMSDIQAGLGISQLDRVNENVEKRHAIACFYDKELTSLPLVLPCKLQDYYSAYHLYIVRLIKPKAGFHQTIFYKLREMGVGVNLHYIPIHTQPFYQKLGFKVGDFPEAEDYYGSALSLPMFSTLTEDQQHYVIKSIKTLLT